MRLGSRERRLGDPVTGRGLRAERRSRDEVLALIEELTGDEDVVERLRNGEAGEDVTRSLG